jgi:cytochrome c553
MAAAGVRLYRKEVRKRSHRSLAMAAAVWVLVGSVPGELRAVSSSQEVLAQIRQRTPDLERGAGLFNACVACHGSDGGGTRDGLVPRLAGQHASVLQRQMVDYRYDRRWDPRMQAVVDRHSLSPESIADVSAYISQLDRDVGVGTGDGSLLRRGAAAYSRSCQGCHGRAAQGDAARAVPRLAGQHYEYLRRQIYDAVDGRRPNFSPSHIRLLARLDRDDIAGISDHLSRLGVSLAASAPQQLKTGPERH